MRRRRFITSGLAAAAGVTTGCLDDCSVGETWQGVGARIEDPVAKPVDDGWRFEADVVVEFSFARGDDLALQDAGVRIWGPDRREISTERVGDVRWSDVSPGDRSTDECGYRHGRTSREVQVTTEEFPAWIRAVGQPTHHLDGLQALRYAREPPEASDGAVDHYLAADYSYGAFPPVDDSEASAGEGITEVDFQVYDCTTDPAWDLSLRRWTGDDDSDGYLEVRGFREVSEPCQRPLLRSVSLEDDGEVVAASIGLHKVERVGCPDSCAHRRYTLTTSTDGELPRRARVEYVDEDGAVVDEHYVRPVGDD